MSLLLVIPAFMALAAVGAAVRHVLSRWFNGTFPYGTLVTNLAASFALGLLAAAGDDARTLLGIGALGALSTWSTVANEAAEMARDRQGLQALLYVWATTSSGIVAAWIGLQTSLPI